MRITTTGIIDYTWLRYQTITATTGDRGGGVGALQ